MKKISLALLLLVLASCKKEDVPMSSLSYKSCNNASLTKKQKRNVASSDIDVFINETKSCRFDQNGPDNKCRLVFGYTNSGSTQNIPIGSNNRMTFPPGEPLCSGQSCGQPTTFVSGTNDSALTLNLVRTGDYKWFVNNSSVNVACPSNLQRVCQIDGPLAVTFVDVSASWNSDRFIKVIWSTASEANTSHFNVQVVKPCRPANEKINFPVPSKSGGQSSTTLNYAADIPVDEGGYYLVNIQEVDLDGRPHETQQLKVKVGR